jgi:hypothetical protein
MLLKQDPAFDGYSFDVVCDCTIVRICLVAEFVELEVIGVELYSMASHQNSRVTVYNLFQVSRTFKCSCSTQRTIPLNRVEDNRPKKGTRVE